MEDTYLTNNGQFYQRNGPMERMFETRFLKNFPLDLFSQELSGCETIYFGISWTWRSPILNH